MAKTIPLILGYASINLYAGDSNGLAILTQPIWVGARAEGVGLNAEISEQEATPSASEFDRFVQLSELHEITIDRIWVLPIGDTSGPGAVGMKDYDLRRGQYVMQIFWIDPTTGLWNQRTYSGVQARRYDLRSNGQANLGSSQSFRAKSFTETGGTSTPDGQLTPITVFNPTEQPLLFTHDDPLAQDDYFIGFYQFAVPIHIGRTKAIGQPSHGTDTILELELNGVLTGTTLDLPEYSGSDEVSDEQIFDIVVPANQTIRWKVTSAPLSARAQFVGITMNIKQS